MNTASIITSAPAAPALTDRKVSLPSGGTVTWTPAIWTGNSDPDLLAAFDCYKAVTCGTTITLRVYHDDMIYPGPFPVVDWAAYGWKSSCRYEFSVRGCYSGCLPASDNDLSFDDATCAIIASVRRTGTRN